MARYACVCLRKVVVVPVERAVTAGVPNVCVLSVACCCIIQPDNPHQFVLVPNERAKQAYEADPKCTCVSWLSVVVMCRVLF